MKTTWVTLLLLAPACPGGDAAVDAGLGDCGLEVTLEVRAPDGEYTSIPPAEDAELVLGFQGFRYVYLRGRADRSPPAASGSVVIEVEGSGPRSQPFGDLAWTADGEGGGVTGALRTFFNDDPLPQLVDRRCTFTLIVGDARCGAAASGSAVLRYDPACYEGPDGARVCPDGGVP
jgi:hypothetical protein